MNRPNHVVISLFLAVFLVAAVLPALAQVAAPNVDSIKAELRRPGGQFEYKMLKSRFLKLDTTLTREQLWYLIAGNCSEEPGYSGFAVGGTWEEIDKLDDKKKYKQALKKSELLLADFPASLSLINLARYFAGESGQKEKESYYSNLLSLLLKGSFRLGDGKTAETAITVVMPRDEYFIANALGLKVKMQRLIHGENGNMYDVLTLTPRPRKGEAESDTSDPKQELELYFNITAYFASTMSLFSK